MDTKELNNRLAKFFKVCKDTGRTIDAACFIPAYPGITDSSYILQIKSEWCNRTICSEALEQLFDILFDTTDVKTRTNIFCIRIMDENEAISCDSANMAEFNYEIQESKRKLLSN